MAVVDVADVALGDSWNKEQETWGEIDCWMVEFLWEIEDMRDGRIDLDLTEGFRHERLHRRLDVKRDFWNFVRHWQHQNAKSI